LLRAADARAAHIASTNIFRAAATPAYINGFVRAQLQQRLQQQLLLGKAAGDYE